MKFILSAIVTMASLFNPAFAMEDLKDQHSSSKPLPAKIFEKDKKYEIPNYPTSVTPWSTRWSCGEDVRLGSAYVFSNCLHTTFNIHNSGRIIGQAEFQYFPEHKPFRPAFCERMLNLSETHQMTRDEKLDSITNYDIRLKAYVQTKFEPEFLEPALDSIALETFDSSMETYEMNLGLTMPVLYLNYINIEENYQRQGHGTRALETIIKAFDNAPEVPENVHILLQCKRYESYRIGAEESEHNKFFKRFGFKSIEVRPADRHFMTVSLEEIKFPRLPKAKTVH